MVWMTFNFSIMAGSLPDRQLGQRLHLKDKPPACRQGKPFRVALNPVNQGARGLRWIRPAADQAPEASLRAQV